MNTSFNIHQIIYMRSKLHEIYKKNLFDSSQIRVKRQGKDVTLEYLAMLVNRIIYEK